MLELSGTGKHGLAAGIELLMQPLVSCRKCVTRANDKHWYSLRNATLSKL